jgi:hypothetical protein
LISWIGWNVSNFWRNFRKVSIHSHCTQTEYLTQSIPCIPLSSQFSEVPSQSERNEFMPFSQVAFIPLFSIRIISNLVPCLQIKYSLSFLDWKPSRLSTFEMRYVSVLCRSMAFVRTSRNVRTLTLLKLRPLEI